jgi:hypothetical protein
VNILHLSDTTLSGSPIRIVDLINKHTEHRARHIVWNKALFHRIFDTDLIGPTLGKETAQEMLDWADVVHYHNRWKRQMLFRVYQLEPPKKPSVIQIHTQREREGFTEEESSGLPIAVLAQYHVRQWPKARFVVPNVVDITDQAYLRKMPPAVPLPVVSYAPSSCNGKGWDDKGYSVISPVLKRLKLEQKLIYDLIVQQPHSITLQRKRNAHIGVDEIMTGSYHLSSLEYLAMGTPCFAHVDELTAAAVKTVTGADELPWIETVPHNFKSKLLELIKDRGYVDAGAKSRAWMEKYWCPKVLCDKYVSMYESL